MSNRSDVYALVQHYQDGFDQLDDKKIREYFIWPVTSLTKTEGCWRIFAMSAMAFPP
jgi:hypothetical protein